MSNVLIQMFRPEPFIEKIANGIANKSLKPPMAALSIFSCFYKLFSKQTEINNLFSKRNNMENLCLSRNILTNTRELIYVSGNYAEFFSRFIS